MRSVYIYNIKKRWGFALAVLLIALAHFVALITPFGGNTLAEVMEANPTLITPARFAFALWTVLLFVLLVFAYFQLTRGKEHRFYRLVWPYFMVGAAFHIFWVIAFQNGWFILSLIFVVGLVASLSVMLRLYYRLRRAMNTTHRYFFKVPFSMYLAWVSVLIPINLFILLSHLDSALYAHYESFLGLLAIAIVALVAGFVLIQKSDYVYPLTIVWILVGIWAAAPEAPAPFHAAKFAAIALSALMVFMFVKDRIRVARYGRSGLNATS